MKRKFRLAIITPELAPYARSGELAEATAGLTKYLARTETEVNVFLPYYRKPEIESLNKELLTKELLVPVGNKKIKTAIFRADLGKYNLYLIDQPKYFHREHIYGSAQGDYPDNDERFIFFNRAALELLNHFKLKPDLIHCHNWAASLMPLFIKSIYQKKATFKKAAVVLTIHNFSYQGEFPAESLRLTGLDWNYLNSHQLAFKGKFNFLKAGLLFAEVINTVSQSYKNEVLQYHQELSSFFSRKNKQLYSIRNGIDEEEWNPATDPLIPANFSAEDLEGKKACKRQLIKEFQLAINEHTPLIAVVGYLTKLKGVDLILENIGSLMATGSALLVVGRGEEAYEQAFQNLQNNYRGKLAIRLDFNSALYHQVIAGADMLLMPSLEEPCGLTVMHALRYGTIPVVRATGGLKESVKPYNTENAQGTGFIFEEYSRQAFLEAINQSLILYQQPAAWHHLQMNCLKQNNSWSRAIKKYMVLYNKAIKIKLGGKIEQEYHSGH
ncbi:MAG: glycogen synthase [Candidatus Aminicenantes bacterium]|jgi:glycogen/starch synthases, ADP-glucose type|nr:glycogen synthase [Candidatus Aminicenantes bacterium]